MKKGISIWSFAGGTLEENFKLAKQAGFDGVEVALDEEGELSLASTEADVKKVKAAADKAGIALYSVASGLYWKYSLSSDDEKMRAKAKECVRKQLQVAAWLGCDTILIVPGAVSVSFSPELGVTDYDVVYERSLAAVKELAADAERLKVSIGLENVWNNFLLSPLEMRDFIDKVGSDYVGSYFDVGNVLYCGYPEQWIKILGKRIKKVHFKDYRRAVGSLDGFVDLLAGDVNWKAVKAEFDKIGYNGWVTGEMIPPYSQYSETIIFNTSNAMDKIIGRK
ncbi:MAG: sugar phosphate isomerase/epimerase [Clostridia bacterium]|nr:sugar phosphate isomerase/epimerase [Clostridia bacterium]